MAAGSEPDSDDFYTVSYTYTGRTTNSYYISILYRILRSTQNLFHDGDQATR
jgi:hypothetical protein